MDDDGDRGRCAAISFTSAGTIGLIRVAGADECGNSLSGGEVPVRGMIVPDEDDDGGLRCGLISVRSNGVELANLPISNAMERGKFPLREPSSREGREELDKFLICLRDCDSDKLGREIGSGGTTSFCSSISVRDRLAVDDPGGLTVVSVVDDLSSDREV